MSFFSPLDATRRHPQLPVVCSSCGYQTTFTEHGDVIDNALIDATDLFDTRLELSLLDRTAALFARFPDSRIALKVNKEQLKPKLFPRTSNDPEFEAALATDPELSLFLRRCTFHLPSRQRFVAQLIAELEERDFSAIRCPACAVGVFRLPDGFFQKQPVDPAIGSRPEGDL